MTSSRSLWFALAAVVAFQIAISVWGTAPWATEGRLMDSDCYMRLQRVLNLYQSGQWFDSFEPRSNAPIGEQLHWTRPLDLILLIGAWIGSAVTDFRSALWAWGVVVSPALLMVGLVVWQWGTRRLVSPGVFLISALMLLLMPMFSAAFMIGRPDHHGLIALCLLGSLACLLRLLSGDERLRLAFYAGLWGGLGLWVSLESLVGQGLIGASLALVWWMRGGREARLLALFCQGLLVMLVVALVVEYKPADWFNVRYARFTIVDVVLAAGCAVPWTIIAAIAERHRLVLKARIGLTLAAGLVTVLVMAQTYPRFFLGPMIDFSPQSILWLSTSSEFEPLWPTSVWGFSEFLFYLGPTLIAIAVCIQALRHGPAERKPVMAVLLLCSLVLLPFGLSAIRWAVACNLMAALPWAMTVPTAWRWRGSLRLAGNRLPLRSVAVAALLSTHADIAQMLNASGSVGPHPTSTTAGGTKGASASDCDWQPISQYLSAQWPQGGVLFSYLFAGGELIWRTPFGLVAAPYQNAESFADSDLLFSTSDDTVAEKILRRRKTTLLLLCPAAGEAREFMATNPDRFHNRLMRGETPPWLDVVPLPPELTGKYELFRLKS